VAVALVHHPACDAHDPGAGHPERPERLAAVRDAVRADPVLADGEVVEIVPPPAALDDLLRVHSAAHVDLLRAVADRADRTGRTDWLDPDTAVSPGTWGAALAAAGCAIAAADAVVRGAAEGALAAVRPPGHHATRDAAMGFCLLNNVAIAARHAQARLGVGRVLVVDWDVHHGNGTQDAFWEDPSVHVLSLHLADHYPGTGAAGERGGGAGLGATRNVPLPAGTGGPAYRAAFSAALGDALDAFAPDLVLVSAGFDVLAGDPLGGLLLEPEDLHAMTRELVERTQPSARGRVAAVLEGGYVPARVGRGAVDVLRALAGLPAAERSDPPQPSVVV
jgi:acetoin utilization deacetylase AcuC-like enzyme